MKTKQIREEQIDAMPFANQPAALWSLPREDSVSFRPAAVEEYLLTGRTMSEEKKKTKSSSQHQNTTSRTPALCESMYNIRIEA
jgi:hypothetical protein